MNEGGKNATSFASIAASRPPAASFAAVARLATDSSDNNNNNSNSSHRRVTPPSLVDLTQDDVIGDEHHEQTTVFPFTEEVDDDDEEAEDSAEQHSPVGSCELTIVGIRCVQQWHGNFGSSIFLFPSLNFLLIHIDFLLSFVIGTTTVLPIQGNMSTLFVNQTTPTIEMPSVLIT